MYVFKSRYSQQFCLIGDVRGECVVVFATSSTVLACKNQMDLFDDAVSSVDSAVTDRSGAAEFIPRRDDGDESGTGPRCEVCDLSSHVTPVKSLREMCKQVRVRFAQNVAHVSVPQIKCDDLRSLTMAERHALRHHIAVVLCTQRQQPMPAAAPAPTPPLIADFVAAVEHENSYDPLVHSDFGTDIRNAQPGHPGPAAHFVLAACVPPATQADLDAAVKDFEQRLLDTTIAAMLGIATRMCKTALGPFATQRANEMLAVARAAHAFVSTKEPQPLPVPERVLSECRAQFVADFADIMGGISSGFLAGPELLLCLLRPGAAFFHLCNDSAASEFFFEDEGCTLGDTVSTVSDDTTVGPGSSFLTSDCDCDHVPMMSSAPARYRCCTCNEVHAELSPCRGGLLLPHEDSGSATPSPSPRPRRPADVSNNAYLPVPNPGTAETVRRLRYAADLCRNLMKSCNRRQLSDFSGRPELLVADALAEACSKTSTSSGSAVEICPPPPRRSRAQPRQPKPKTSGAPRLTAAALRRVPAVPVAAFDAASFVLDAPPSVALMTPTATATVVADDQFDKIVSAICSQHHR